jgi:hypothetical protein
VLASAWLTLFLAWYDREAAASAFEPVRAWMDRADDRELARATVEFQAWSTFDPRAAVVRLEQVPVNPRLDLDQDSAGLGVADLLGLPHESRWRNLSLNNSYMEDILRNHIRAVRMPR